MSLSPQDYEKSIGRSVTKHGSCLVYLDGTLIGERPSGCDGWTLKVEGGHLTSNGMIYPPIWLDGNTRYTEGDIEESRQMLARAVEIIDEYNRDKTY